MTDKDPYQILGLAPNASEEEIKKAYCDSVSNCYEQNGSLQELYDISNAYMTLKDLSAHPMIPDTGEEPRELVKNPGWETLWEKSVSPAFVLGIIFTGIAGGLIGYSLQPKQTVVREIIREAQVPNATPAPLPPADRGGVKEQSSSTQQTMDKSSSKVTVASNPPLPSQKTTARNNPNALSTVNGKRTSTLPGLAKPSKTLPRSPQASPTTEQRPAELLPDKSVLAPVVQNPNLLPPSSAFNQSFPSAKPPQQNPVQKTSPSTSKSTEAPANDEEANKLIDQIDAYKSSQQSPQPPRSAPRKQSNVTTPSTQMIPKSSTEKVLETIQIPMEDGTSVPANKLLHLDTEVWKLDKGETRKKLNVLVNELIKSRNLNSACTKADISLDGLRLLIKKYGNA